MGRRSVGFEGVPERTPTRREWAIVEGSNGRSQRRENTEVNLPPLLAAHLGRTEAGVPLQPFPVSSVEGNPLPFNVGGNLPPNGMYPQFQAQTYPQNLYPSVNGQPSNHNFPQATTPFGHPIAYPPYTICNSYPFNMNTPYHPYLNQTPSGVPPNHNPYPGVPMGATPYNFCIWNLRAPQHHS